MLSRRGFLLLALMGGASLSVLSGCAGGSAQQGSASATDAAKSYQDKVFDTSFVHADPNAMYTVEEFDQAVKDLQEYITARAENIRAQLTASKK